MCRMHSLHFKERIFMLYTPCGTRDAEIEEAWHTHRVKGVFPVHERPLKDQTGNLRKSTAKSREPFSALQSSPSSGCCIVTSDVTV
jgi:hypothetical protein